jgi:hypothetical protein
LQNLGGKFLHKNATCPDKPEAVARKILLFRVLFGIGIAVYKKRRRINSSRGMFQNAANMNFRVP